MFYTIYDAIVFKAEKNGIKEEEVRKKLRKRGFTSERLGLLKNNCTTKIARDIINKNSISFKTFFLVEKSGILLLKSLFTVKLPLFLNCNFYLIAFNTNNTTFVVTITCCSWSTYNFISICF